MSELDQRIRDLIYDLEEIGGVTLHPDPETGEEDRPPTFSIGEDGHALIKAFVEEQTAALQRRVEWTRERPTEPGWYWAKWPKQPQYGPEILEITQPDGPDTDTFEVGHKPLNETLDEYLDREAPVEWQGPITPHEARG